MILPFYFTFYKAHAPWVAQLAKELAGPKYSWEDADTVTYKAPLTCAWLFAQEAATMGLALLKVKYPKEATPDGAPWGERDVEEGRRLLADMIREGVFKEKIEISPGNFKDLLDFATPYQLGNIAWGSRRPYMLKIWAPGGGKTFGTQVSVLNRIWRIRSPWGIIAPAKARNNVWGRQIERYTGDMVSAQNITPESLRRKSWVPVQDHLAECRRNGQIPVYVIGQESLPAYWQELQKVCPGALAFDEIHLLRDRKRWERTPGEDGRRELKLKDNRSAIAWQLSKEPSVFYREGLTATPMGTGLPRSLYAQFTLLDPGGWGGYWEFADRYCGAHQHPELGYMVDKGAERLDELRQRASFMIHEVSYVQSHGHLPPLRWEVYEVDTNRLNRATGRRELEKEIGKSGAEAKVELQIALAGSRKEKAAIEDTKEAVELGQKVVIFTIRHLLCERLIAKVKEALPDTLVVGAHGGHTQKFKDEQFDAFLDAPGAAVFIGTGDAWGTAVDGLQCAHLALILGFPWIPEQLEQWKGRFDRPLEGKEAGTIVRFYYARGTIEDMIISRLVQEIGNIEQFMAADALQGAAAKLHMREDEAAFKKRMVSWVLSASGGEDE